jgi:hypothetical protein
LLSDDVPALWVGTGDRSAGVAVATQGQRHLIRGAGEGMTERRTVAIHVAIRATTSSRREHHHALGAAQRMTGEVACPPFRRRVETTATRRAASLFTATLHHAGEMPLRRGAEDLGRNPALVDVVLFRFTPARCGHAHLRSPHLRLPLDTRSDPLPGRGRLWTSTPVWTMPSMPEPGMRLSP